MNILYQRAGSPNRIVPVDQQLISGRAVTIAENCLKLCSVAATVILCGRQA